MIIMELNQKSVKEERFKMSPICGNNTTHSSITKRSKKKSKGKLENIETNEIENITWQILWDVTKVILAKKFT